MAVAIRIVAKTIIGAKQFGKICFTMILTSDAPSDFMAMIYSFSLIERTDPLTILAQDGIDQILIAIATLTRLVPKMAIMSIASKIPGKENSKSTILIITPSSFL